MPTRRNKPLDKDGSDPCGGEPFELKIPVQHVEQGRPRKVAKPMDYGKCPECTAPKVAVLRSGKHWVWKEHTFATWGRARFTCRASGIAICDLPEGTPTLHHSEPMRCPCERRTK